MDLPSVFPNPQDELGPHPLARRAAEALQAELRQGLIAPGLATAVLDAGEGGKMFGVLVVQDGDGRFGFLRAFSGLLAGRWQIEGYAPPLFDAAARAAIEPAGDAQVKRLQALSEAFRGAARVTAIAAQAQALDRRHEMESTALRARHAASRQQRLAARAQAPDAAALHALEQQSRGDKAEKRRLAERHTAERAVLAPAQQACEQALRRADMQRQALCRKLLTQIQDTYCVPDGHGEQRPLRALFAPDEPPAGAGDCAAPKLLAAAHRQGLRPVALAEFWWGAPPRSGGRLAGKYYPACRDKCAPMLPFLLDGLALAPAQFYTPPDLRAAPLPVLFEDEWLIVVDKPCGLLSVPGRNAAVTDSVLARLRAQWPRATGPLLVHRLDLDTSGLLIAAKDLESHEHLQRQFARREVAKRYVAWLDGDIQGQRGTIDLPLRVDVDDRPRQIHDPVHGKPAVTDWQVLAHHAGRTRVALFPRTGRTHQLRVHAAHPLGLGAPIVGDRLYGHGDRRMLLHAESLTVVHPHTGQRLTVTAACPF